MRLVRQTMIGVAWSVVPNLDSFVVSLHDLGTACIRSRRPSSRSCIGRLVYGSNLRFMVLMGFLGRVSHLITLLSCGGNYPFVGRIICG